MPELPEVETTCRALRNSKLIGRRIIGVEVRPNEHEKLAELVAARPLLCESTITEVARRGKYILLTATRQPTPAAAIELVIHLRMSGRLWISPAAAATDEPAAAIKAAAAPTPTAAPPSARSGYERAVWHLADGEELRFYDPRRFGTVCVYASSGDARAPTTTPARAARDAFLREKCGIEPLSANFTAAWCAAALHKRRRALKALLLDQTVIAGLGNIYCDEALWWAHLHPKRKGDSLTASEVAQLCRAIRAVLIKGIRHGGTRLGNGVSNFQLPQQHSQNREELHAYGRTNHPCPRCTTTIKRIIVAGRGTHICPHCQR